MSATFWYTLARSRGQIIGWGTALVLLGMLIISFYPTVLEQQAQILQLVESLPPQFTAFFGRVQEFATPHGFLGARYFGLMPVILGIYAVVAGSGLIVADEENGTLDLILAHPISRTDLFVGRLLALIVAVGTILAMGWLGLVIPTAWVEFDATWVEIARPFIALLVVVLLFGTLALLLSMVLPSQRMAAMMSGIAVITSYFVSSLARVEGSLEGFAKMSPLSYYQSGDAMLGLNSTWLAGLLLPTLLFALAAWWLFQRRDIRVVGEGGWNFRLRLRRRMVTT
jgi:ABC-2 type transport system permease protein